jgi:hypothetical protein
MGLIGELFSAILTAAFTDPTAEQAAAEETTTWRLFHETRAKLADAVAFGDAMREERRISEASRERWVERTKATERVLVDTQNLRVAAIERYDRYRAEMRKATHRIAETVRAVSEENARLKNVTKDLPAFVEENARLRNAVETLTNFTHDVIDQSVDYPTGVLWAENTELHKQLRECRKALHVIFVNVPRTEIGAIAGRALGLLH